jgi:hypothetical protein
MTCTGTYDERIEVLRYLKYRTPLSAVLLPWMGAGVGGAVAVLLQAATPDPCSPTTLAGRVRSTVLLKHLGVRCEGG